MPRKCRLLNQLRDNPLCVGFAWEASPGSGKYEYQNDNDLGLDADGLEGVVIEAEKIPLGDGRYMLLDSSFAGDGEGSERAADLDTVKALLKECHPHLFKLTEEEAALCRAYWARF